MIIKKYMFEHSYDENNSFKDDLLSIDSLTIEKNFSQKCPFDSSIDSLFQKNDYKIDQEKTTKSSLKFTSNRKKTLFTLYKRGRKKDTEKVGDNYNKEYYHNKLASDNLLKRVQTHYMTFIIDYANEVIHKFGFKDDFVQPNSVYKKNVNKNNISLLKGKNIGYILSLDISPKFRTQNKIQNKILYEEVIKIPILKNLFDENYISLFNDIYYKNKKDINLIYDDKNYIIHFQKVKTFDALEDKIKKKDKMSKEDTEIYIKKLKDLISKKYLSNDNELFEKFI